MDPHQRPQSPRLTEQPAENNSALPPQSPHLGDPNLPLNPSLQLYSQPIVSQVVVPPNDTPNDSAADTADLVSVPVRSLFN